MGAGLADVILAAPMAAGQEDGVPVAPMAAGQEDAIPVAPMGAGQEDGVPVAPMGAGQEDGIPAARMAASQKDGIPAARRVADPEVAIPVPMAAGREVVILVALMVAVRRTPDPADALLSVATRRDVPLRCVGSTGVRCRPSTGLARAASRLRAPEHRHPVVVDPVGRRRPALEDAGLKTAAPLGVGLTVLLLAPTVEVQVDERQDRVLLSGRWAPADRPSASWGRHQVGRCRRQVDRVAAWPRSGAAFHPAER